MRDILLELLIMICPQGRGEKVLSLIKPYVNFDTVFRGKGTASSEILAAIGFGEPEKEVVFTFCENKNVRTIYGVLKEAFPKSSERPFSMTVPVSAVGGNLTLQILLGNTKDLI